MMASISVGSQNRVDKDKGPLGALEPILSGKEFGSIKGNNNEV